MNDTSRKEEEMRTTPQLWFVYYRSNLDSIIMVRSANRFITFLFMLLMHFSRYYYKYLSIFYLTNLHKHFLYTSSKYLHQVDYKCSFGVSYLENTIFIGAPSRHSSNTNRILGY